MRACRHTCWNASNSCRTLRSRETLREQRSSSPVSGSFYGPERLDKLSGSTGRPKVTEPVQNGPEPATFLCLMTDPTHQFTPNPLRTASEPRVRERGANEQNRSVCSAARPVWRSGDPRRTDLNEDSGPAVRRAPAGPDKSSRESNSARRSAQQVQLRPRPDARAPGGAGTPERRGRFGGFCGPGPAQTRPDSGEEPQRVPETTAADEICRNSVQLPPPLPPTRALILK